MRELRFYDAETIATIRSWYEGMEWPRDRLVDQILELSDALCGKDAEIERLSSALAERGKEILDLCAWVDRQGRAGLLVTEDRLGLDPAAASKSPEHVFRPRLSPGATTSPLMRSDHGREKRHDSDSCHWPGCKNPGLCQSGNFGNQVVCGEHFKITNGAGRFWEGYRAGKEREQAECATKGRHYEDAVRERDDALTEVGRLRAGYEGAVAATTEAITQRDEARREIERLMAFVSAQATTKHRDAVANHHEALWLLGLLAEERKRADCEEIACDHESRDAERLSRTLRRARERLREAEALAELRLAEIRRLRSRRISGWGEDLASFEMVAALRRALEAEE